MCMCKIRLRLFLEGGLITQKVSLSVSEIFSTVHLFKIQTPALSTHSPVCILCSKKGKIMEWMRVENCTKFTWCHSLLQTAGPHYTVFLIRHDNEGAPADFLLDSICVDLLLDSICIYAIHAMFCVCIISLYRCTQPGYFKPILELNILLHIT